MLAVCFPQARGANPRTVKCLLQLDLPKPYLYTDPVGLQVDIARNAMTSVALAYKEVTHLMFIDDDMTFDRDAVRRLLTHDLPIVGGLCHNRRPPYPPILIHDSPRGFEFQYDYPEGLVEVDATGAAFLLVKREVFEAIRAEFPDEEPWRPKGVSEDVSFCRRAREAGFKVFVDTTIKIGHVGEVVVDEGFAARNRTFKAQPWFPKKMMPPGSPRASIIVPTYNQCPAFLRTAVESALCQTVPVEVIVVDDGSNVPARTVLLPEVETGIFRLAERAGRLRIVRHEENLGCYPALNTGISEMRTPWFVWLSSDDILYANKVEAHLAAMETTRLGEVDYVPGASFCGYDVLLPFGAMSTTVITPYNWKTIAEQDNMLSQGCVIGSPTPMIHLNVLDLARLPNGDYFDTSLPIVADWDLWCRVGREVFWRPVNEILVTRREHEGNDSTRFMLDPEKKAQWMREIEIVKKRYGNTVKETP